MPFAAVVMLVVCITCYTVQTFFNKMFSISYRGPAAAATPVFASLYGLIVGGATLVYAGFQFHPSVPTLVMGAANGVVLFLFNLSSINAARTGPYAFQSIMLLFGNILLTLLFSTLWWGDQLRPVQILGIGVMLLSFVIFNLQSLHFDGMKKGYLGWVLLLFFANGLYGILVDAQQRVLLQQERNEMIMITFAVSAVISLLYLAAVQGRAAARAFRMDARSWIFAVGSSLGAAVAIHLLMLTLRLVPASVLYTVINGSILVLSALLSAVVLREKLTRSMVAGIAVAVISLVLLSL